MGPKIQFPKKVLPTYFFIHKTCFTTFHIQVIVPLWDQNFNFLLKPKNQQKFFRPHFSNNFTSYCPPMGPKFQFPKKVFPTNFFTHKTCFTTFHID